MIVIFLVNILLGTWLYGKIWVRKTIHKPEFEPDPNRQFTLLQLAAYDGIQKRSIFVGVHGFVFDVSSAVDRYGPGSSYASLAGRDSSRFLATHRLPTAKDQADPLVYDDLSDLTEKQLESLQGWFQFYREKYPIVGKISP